MGSARRFRTDFCGGRFRWRGLLAVDIDFSVIISAIGLVGGAMWAMWWKIDSKIERKATEAATAAETLRVKMENDAGALYQRVEQRKDEVNSALQAVRDNYVRRDDLDRRFNDLAGEVHSLGTKIDGVKDTVVAALKQTIDALAKSRPPAAE
jgi:hypothetical protein